jgi:hypothetical protein
MRDLSAQAKKDKALEILVKDRQSAMAAWTCRALDIVAKVDAVNSITDCMRLGPLIPDATQPSPAISCDFEDANICGWQNIAGTGNKVWTRTSGRTPSSINSWVTGPNGAAHGSHYMFTESSNPNYPNKVFFMNSPDFPETQEPFMLTFQYHMYGAAIGDLGIVFIPCLSVSKTTFVEALRQW